MIMSCIYRQVKAFLDYAYIYLIQEKYFLTYTTPITKMMRKLMDVAKK